MPGNGSGERKKVAILGGGPAGLATAFYLTEHAPLDYDITIYQMGWRVGGKGTSGYRRWTPPGASEPIWNRIEEHGLHVLFGFYENFFSVMRKCYSAMDRPAGHPLRRFDCAFKARDFGTAMYRHRSRWKQLNVWFRRNDEKPGVGATLDSGDHLDMLSGAFFNFLSDWLFPGGNPNTPPPTGALRNLFIAVGDAIKAVLQRVRRWVAQHPSWVLALLRFWQRHLRRWTRPFMNLFGSSYLLWLGADFGAGLLVGLIQADLIDSDDFSSIDDRDYRQWLVDSGIHPDTAASPYVNMIYHAAFSYEGGEPQRPRVAAGAALSLTLNAMLQYRGSAYYAMRGGMGEVVFVPLWKTLNDRGVKFEFFNKVEALHLDAAGTSIASIDVIVQADLASSTTAYAPTVEVRDVEVFPSIPLYEQLAVQAQDPDIQYASYYQASYPTGHSRTLTAGTHFDHVVLATPIATLPYVAQELLDGVPGWQEMVDHVKSVQTLSLQVWFNESHLEMGWRLPDESDPYTLLSMYAKPMSTWVPMDLTLPRENWPTGMEPAAVGYFTGAQPGPDVAPHPSANPDFVSQQNSAARALSESFIQYVLAEDLLPNLEDPISPPLPRFEALHDPENREGTARMAAQYVRSNCEPSDRCTLALPGSGQHRMRAGDTGVANLTISGDWTDNGFQLACMEGAFTSGRLAADAILDQP